MAEGVVSTTAAEPPAAHGWSACVFRPIILFATAYIIAAAVHEWSHALTAYALNVPSTLYHFGVNLERDRGTLIERAVIGIAGPLCSLAVGLAGWLAYRRARGARSELLLLYFAIFGVSTFFGNLMSAAFVGDFSRAAHALRLPAPARYAMSLVGLLSLCGLTFMAGAELRRLAPAGSRASHALVVMVVLPAVFGTAAATLAHLPMPSPLALARLAEASFWIFGATGLLVSRSRPSGSGQTLRLNWADSAAFLAAVLALRVMSGGIALQP